MKNQIPLSKMTFPSCLNAVAVHVLCGFHKDAAMVVHSYAYEPGIGTAARLVHEPVYVC